jgi:hypothetical protein
MCDTCVCLCVTNLDLERQNTSPNNGKITRRVLSVNYSRDARKHNCLQLPFAVDVFCNYVVNVIMCNLFKCCCSKESMNRATPAVGQFASENKGPIQTMVELARMSGGGGGGVICVNAYVSLLYFFVSRGLVNPCPLAICVIDTQLMRRRKDVSENPPNFVVQGQR